MKFFQKRGFTLIEIMIVMAVIGLLSVIGISYVFNAYSYSQDKVKVRVLGEVETAKRILTLPESSSISGAMGLEDEQLIIQNNLKRKMEGV